MLFRSTENRELRGEQVWTLEQISCSMAVSSEVQFKEISIVYAGNDFVLCDSSPTDGTLFSGETISLYDQIITEGDDLYDGKVIK